MMKFCCCCCCFSLIVKLKRSGLKWIQKKLKTVHGRKCVQHGRVRYGWLLSYVKTGSDLDRNAKWHPDLWFTNSCFKFGHCETLPSRLQSNRVVYEHAVNAEAKLESVTGGRIFIKEWACWTDVLIPSQADAHTVGVHKLCFPPFLLHYTLPHFAFISVYMHSIL